MASYFTELFSLFVFHKATSTYNLCSTGVSYSRAREIVLQAFVQLGYPKNLFGLHSLRAGRGGVGGG